MPFGGLLTAGVSAGAGIISNLIGGSSAQKAANQQRAAGIAAANQVNATEAQTGQNIGGNVANAQQWSTDATQAAQGLSTGATQAAQGLSSQGVAQANQGIGANAAQIQQNFSPYTAAGATAVGGLANLANGGGTLGSTFTAPTAASLNNPNAPGSAGYQFTLQQGQQAIQRAAAAQGGLFSTGTLKSLANYTTGTANQYYGQAYNQALQSFQANQQSALNQAGVLQGLSGQGLAATGSASNALQTAGLAQGQNITQGAQYQGTTGIQGAQYQGTIGTQGAQYAGNIGYQGALAGGQLANQAAVNAGNFATNASNAQAQGTISQGLAQQGIVNSVANGLSGYLSGLSSGISPNSPANQQVNNLPIGSVTNPNQSLSSILLGSV